MNPIQTVPLTQNEIRLAEQIYVQLIHSALTSNSVTISDSDAAQGAAKLAFAAAKTFYNVLLNSVE